MMFVNMPGRSGGTDARSASETSGLVKRKKANGRVMHEGDQSGAGVGVARAREGKGSGCTMRAR
jgi:hypothetical protein